MPSGRGTRRAALDPLAVQLEVLTGFSRSFGGWQKYSISICSNSSVRKMNLPGVISLRKLTRVCAMPNGSFRRMEVTTFSKLMKMPCAVSGGR